MHSSAASQTPIEGLPLVFVIPSAKCKPPRGSTYKIWTTATTDD